MPRYIDADKVLQYPLRRDYCDKEHADPHFINGVESVMEYIEYLAEEEPTDVQEVKHGIWEYDKEASIPHIERIYRCSVCHKGEAWGETEKTPYCPECGAKLDGENDEN